MNAFVAKFRALGGDIVGPVEYPTTATSFDAILRRIPPTGNDGYYVVGLPPDLAGMYNAIRREPNGKHVPIFTAVAAETAEFRALVGPTLDNLFFTAPSVDQSSSAYFEFREAYRRRFGGDSPDVVSAITYDALRIAVASVKRSGCDPTRIKDHIYQMAAYDGVTGPTAFDDLGDVVTKPVAIRYYEEGQLRLAVRERKEH